jgi:hypothetical protein
MEILLKMKKGNRDCTLYSKYHTVYNVAFDPGILWRNLEGILRQKSPHIKVTNQTKCSAHETV